MHIIPFQVPREPNWALHEIEALSHYIKENRVKLFGSGAKGIQSIECVKKESWEECAEVIRAAGGEARTWKKVRQKWRNVSSEAKKYYAKRIARNETGNHS